MARGDSALWHWPITSVPPSIEEPCIPSRKKLRSSIMRHRKWISAQQLDRWADSNDAKSRLPELIRHLVHATIEPADLEHVDFPAGEETHRPGYDGVTKARRGNAKVPDGIAYWEMGADLNVKRKLNDDFDKRLKKRGPGDFREVTYIAITPRDYQNRKWADEKNDLGHWGEVRLYDSNGLEQWLEMAPGVALWLSRYVSTPPEGLLDLSTHWDNLQEGLKRPLPASVLLVSRLQATESFKEWLGGSPRVLTVRGQSPQEVVDVFTAWVKSLPEAEQDPIASRAIIIEKATAWRELVDSEQRLILICAERLEVDETLIAEARRKGHHVLLPRSSVPLQESDVLRLERMNRPELENVLREAGLSEQEAYSIAQHSGGSFSVLKRGFSSVPLISTPKWGQGRDAEELAPLLLAGAWRDECTADQTIVSKIADRSYSEVRKVVSRWRPEPDAPVRWGDGAWEFVSPLDAWNFLHPALSPGQLDAWEDAAREVLGADDPRLELTPEERWQAKVHGKQFVHSDELRQGLARTLALLATRDGPAQVTDTISLQTRVNRVVRAILPGGTKWQRWASVGRLLTLIAEAAPDMFLDAVESSLRGDQPELPKLFAQEGGGITGWAEHTGLLWALEGLAWSQQLLSRVTIVLAKLDEHDPGGQWANRPKASLRDIFFSWMPHTAAPLEQRLEVLELLLRRHPDVGWKLLLDLLPHGSEIIMNHHTPEWRFWAEGWQRGVTRADYWRTVRVLIQLAVSTATDSPQKWLDLIGHLAHWPRDEFERAVDALERVAGPAIGEELQRKLWDVLREETQSHRYFSDAHWALPSEAVSRLEAVRDRLQPADPVELAAPLFKQGFETLGDKSLSWEQREELRRQRRAEAVRAVLTGHGLAGVLRLARCVQSAWDVGMTLAEATEAEYESQILPALLCCGEKPIEQFAGFYAVHRIRRAGRDWAESLLLTDWRADEAAAFAACMPFDKRTWDFVARLGEPVETEYWNRTGSYAPGLSPEEVEQAARKLIAVGRPSPAIDLLAMTANEKGRAAPAILLELLDMTLAIPQEKGKRALEPYHIQTLLEQLQRSPEVDESKLARLEWGLLPILNRHRRLPATLHKLLARDPGFFIELLTLLYRPRPRTDEQEPQQEKVEPDESTRRQAKRAWHLLHDWQRVPGTKEDGTVDAEQLRAWVKSAREKAAAVDRLEVCDITLGEVLAQAPGEQDGTWPCIPVRDVIDAADSPKLEQGFVIGISNKRGVYSKSLHEGGSQERELAAKYESYAKACQSRWPRTAAALMRVVAGYLEDARREDQEAEAER